MLSNTENCYGFLILMAQVLVFALLGKSCNRKTHQDPNSTKSEKAISWWLGVYYSAEQGNYFC